MTDFRDNFDDDLNDDLDDDFTAFREDLFSDDEGSPSVVEDLPPLDDIEDEFDQLRRKSTRGESLDDDLDEDDAFFSDESSSSGFSWSNFTPGQRLILAMLVLLNIIIGIVGLLVVTGNLG
jgi:hypothetical protein